MSARNPNLAPLFFLLSLAVVASALEAEGGLLDASMHSDSLEGSLTSGQEQLTDLSAELSAAHVEQHRLALENEELRHQVSGWMSVGSKVLKREAKIVEAIQQSHYETAVRQWEQHDSPFALAETGRARETRFFSSPLLLWLVIAIPVLAAFVYYLVKRPDAARQTLMPALAVGVIFTGLVGFAPFFLKSGAIATFLPLFIIVVLVAAAIVFGCLKPEASQGEKPTLFTNMLSRRKVFELTELQLEGIPSDFGEAYLVLEPSDGKDASRTRVEEQHGDSSVLRFSEVMSLSMKKGDSPALVGVYRRRADMHDTRIGSAELQASELLNTHGQAPRLYFRFKIEPETFPALMEDLSIAMRIRQVKQNPVDTSIKAKPYRSKLAKNITRRDMDSEELDFFV